MDEPRYPVIVLAGGKSTRLGRDKASEVLAGKTLLQRVIDACEPVASSVLVVSARGQEIPAVTAHVPIETVEDAYPETGPLGGIHTGLEHVRALSQGHDAGEAMALVVACDMPLLQPALLRELLRLSPGHDAIVPVLQEQPEPLCAVYSIVCVEASRRLLEVGEYKVAGLLNEIDSLLVPETQWRPFDRGGLSFLNVNREDDLERARQLIAGHQAGQES